MLAKDELIAMVKNQREIQHEIVVAVNKMKTAKYIELLEYRYIYDWESKREECRQDNTNFDLWQFISGKCGYSKRHAIRMHGRALEEFYKCHLTVTK